MPPAPTVHLLNPLENALGGSELRTVHLFETLCERAEVSLWTESQPDPRLLGRVPIRLVEPGRGRIPVGGTLVIVGVYFPIGSWLGAARPNRTVVVYNTWQPHRLAQRMRLLAKHGIERPEVVFASELLRRATPGLDGPVHPSVIDLTAFRPAPGPRPERAFTVGRLSRDVPEKHHPGDMGLYGRLVSCGCKVRLMGATCLVDGGAPPEGIEVLHAGAEPAPEFLRSLDCFYYRASEL
jgi:hypothetical protein